MTDYHFADQEALLYRLASAEQEVVFLVGSALTKTTHGVPGVPGVWDMIERIKGHFAPDPTDPEAKAVRKREALVKLGAVLETAENPYQAGFRFLIERMGVPTANALVAASVLAACKSPPPDVDADGALQALDFETEAWHLPVGVRALGALAARHRDRFGRTILTTNFDPLIEAAIRAADGRAHSTVLVNDGALEVTRGEGTHVVHAHGYWVGADTLHTPTALQQDRPQLRASLARLYDRRTLVVMAYGGWDDVFTQSLQEVVGDPGAFTEVLWCFYSDDDADIIERQARLLTQLAPALSRQRATLYKGIDCHHVLPALLRAVDEERAEVEQLVIGRQPVCDALVKATNEGHAVQLIGAEQMGKSSLLEWFSHRTPTDERTVALINARGVTHRSPVDLVKAVAEATGRQEEALARLTVQRSIPTEDDAARVLRWLCPLRLLVDNAQLLSSDGHGFTSSFWGQLRALCADGHLHWISASTEDLCETFGGDREANCFFGPAVRLGVGALEREAVSILLAEQLGETGAAQALRLGGTLPAAVRWLSRQRGPFTSDPEWVAQRFRSWFSPLLERWWRILEPMERAAIQGVSQGTLEGDATIVVPALVERGLLVRDAEGVHPNGEVLADFAQRWSEPVS